MQFSEVETTVRKYMLLADKGILRLVCASMLSNFLPTPPSWLFVVGGSSGGKSMILTALKGVNGVFEVDDLTAQTFASGMKGQGEASLLNNLPDNGTLLIKDYTTILSKDDKARAQILGQMRKIFDGDFNKSFGNGQQVGWEGKLNLLAGVTTEIYSMGAQGSNAALGERYLYYMMEMSDREAVGMMSLEEIQDREAQTEMRRVFNEYLNPLIKRITNEQREGTFQKLVIPYDVRLDLVRIAELTTRARSSVRRNMYSREKEIEHVNALEMTPRFVKALACIAYGLLLMHRYDEEPEELTEQDKAILFKIALDSIPLSRKLVLTALALMSGTVTDLRGRLSLPDSTLRIFLDDLVALGVVTITKSSTWVYSIKDNYKALMDRYSYLNMATASIVREEVKPVEVPAETAVTEDDLAKELGF